MKAPNDKIGNQKRGKKIHQTKQFKKFYFAQLCEDRFENLHKN